MTLRFNAYRFYLRLWVYALPLAAFCLAAYARFYDLSFRPLPVGHDSRFYVVLLLLTTLIWSIAAEHNGLFDLDELIRENTGVRKTFAAVGSTYLTVVCVLFFYRQQNVSRLFFAISIVALFAMTLATRVFFRRLVRKQYSRRPVRVLIIGAEEYAVRVASRLAKIPFAPSEVVAHVRMPWQKIEASRVPVLEMSELGSGTGIAFDEVVIALPASHIDSLSTLVKQLDGLHVPIRAVLDVGDTPIIRDRLFQLGDLQFLDLASTPLESPTYFVVKRAFDITFAVVLMTVGSPLFLLIALAIKLNSRGPVVFGQERVGLNGRVFTMYKFRTMHVAPPSVSDCQHTAENDPRRTSVGKLLRRTSLDELPQFLNVLMGDMSVVGPRPELTFFAQKYAQEVVNYNTRHRLKVGITGWAQINGWRGNTSIQRRIDADIYYLQNWTLWFDLRIVLLTIFKGMVAKQAY